MVKGTRGMCAGFLGFSLLFCFNCLVPDMGVWSDCHNPSLGHVWMEIKIKLKKKKMKRKNKYFKLNIYIYNKMNTGERVIFGVYNLIGLLSFFYFARNKRQKTMVIDILF